MIKEALKQIFACKIKHIYAGQLENGESIHKIRHNCFANGTGKELELVSMQKEMNMISNFLFSHVETLAPGHCTVTVILHVVLQKAYT